MIYKNGNLVLKIQQDVFKLLQLVLELTHHKIGMIYKGTKLVWRTIYDAIRSCYGSGTWIPTQNWIADDTWKNN